VRIPVLRRAAWCSIQLPNRAATRPETYPGESLVQTDCYGPGLRNPSPCPCGYPESIENAERLLDPSSAYRIESMREHVPTLRTDRTMSSSFPAAPSYQHETERRQIVLGRRRLRSQNRERPCR